LQNCDVDPAAVASEARAELVEVRGRTMVLREKKTQQVQKKKLGKNS